MNIPKKDVQTLGKDKKEDPPEESKEKTYLFYSELYSRDLIVEFFRDVADQSSTPILIYNYQGATPGFDMDSDAIIAPSQHPNIFGCKLTCGNTGKLNRVVAVTTPGACTKNGTSSAPRQRFLCMYGSADFRSRLS